MNQLNEQDFVRIYDEYNGKLLQYVKRLVGEQDAEEVCQTAFERLSRNLGTFKGKSKLSTWLFRIATNAALDQLKSPSFKRSSSGPLAPFPIHYSKTEASVSGNRGNMDAPDNKIIREEMSECIREYVDMLPINYRTIIILNEINGLSNREIADILGISLEAAKIRLHRARARLKTSLEAGCDFYLDGRSELACDRKQPTCHV